MRTIIASFALLISAAAPVAAAPLPADKPGYTERDLDEQRVAWVETYFVDPLTKYAAKPPTERHIAFVRESVMWSDRMYAIGDRSKLIEEAIALNDTNPDDPWLLTMIAREYFQDSRRPLAAPIANRALELVEHSKYPTWFRYLIADTAVLASRSTRQKDGDPALRAQAMKYFLEWIASDFAPRADDRFFYLQMRRPVETMFGEDLMPQFIEKLRAVNTGNQWQKNIILGIWEVKEAWKARGSGYASEVKSKSWPVFYQHLESAEAAFTAAHAIHPDFPDAAYQMITVAKGLGERSQLTQRDWFDRAVAAQFDYHAAYAEYFGNLLPRWGGSHEEMFDFARECYETNRFDTRVPYTLIFMLETIRADFDSKLDFLADSPELYGMTETILDRYIKDYTTELPTIGNRYRKALVEYRLKSFPTQRAVLAWWAQDWSDGYAALASVGFAPNTEIAQRLGADRDRTWDELALYGGPASAPALAGRAALAKGDKPIAQKHYAKAGEIIESAKATMPEVERNLALRALERQALKAME